MCPVGRVMGVVCVCMYVCVKRLVFVSGQGERVQDQDQEERAKTACVPRAAEKTL